MRARLNAVPFFCVYYPVSRLQPVDRPLTGRHVFPRHASLLLVSVGLLLLLVIFSTSCIAGQDSGEEAEARYQDGSYAARYRYYDGDGYRPVLQLTIVEGKIDAVEFTEIGIDGTAKALDPAYQTAMAAESPTYPSVYTAALERALLERQEAPVDAVSGATESSQRFNALARAVLRNAVKGDSSVAVLPMDETYTAAGGRDAEGWTGTISITYRRGRIENVEYDEVFFAAGGVVARKSNDRAYAERYEAVAGVTPTEVFELLEANLEQTGAPGQVDVVTGATESSRRFVALAREALSLRFGPDGIP